MPILYNCYPIADLRVIPISKILTRACLAPCFLDGMSEYHIIQHRYQSLTKLYFDGGQAAQADTQRPTGKGSKLYELNFFAMNLGRAKQCTESLKDELE